MPRETQTRDQRIAALHGSEMTNREIGKRFGVSAPTVSLIFRRAGLPPRRPGGFTAKRDAR